MKVLTILLIALSFAVPVMAERYTTLTVSSPVIPPGGSASVSAGISSYHINIHKISATADGSNGKGRVDIYKRGTILIADRLYSRLFTGSFTDPDGVIRTEGFALSYEDADSSAHPAARQLHILFTNTSSQQRSYTLTILYEALAGPTGALDVRQFGAVGDGTTDDTEPIQRAINQAIINNQRKVFIPAGNYKITSSLHSDDPSNFREPLIIEGTGPGSVLINQAPAGNPTIRLLGKFEFHIRNLAITGRAGFPNDAIFIAGVNCPSANCQRSAFGTISDLDLYPNGNGIHLQDTNTVSIERIRYWMESSLASTTGLGPSDPALKHAILADGLTAVNSIQIDSLNSTGYASIANGGSAISWNTFPDTSGDIRVYRSELEGQNLRAIDLNNVFNFSVEDNFLENAETRLIQSRHGSIKSNEGGKFKVGDGTSSGACAYITFYATKAERLEADEFNLAVRVFGGLFDIEGYDNRSTNRAAINVFGLNSTLIPDDLGALGIRERGRDVPMGEWTSPAYDASAFTASTGNWFVDSSDIVTFGFTQIGKTITVNFFLSSTAISGGPASLLQVRIPGNFTAKSRVMSLGNSSNNSSVTDMTIEVRAQQNLIFLSRGNLGILGDWQDGSANIMGSITFEVE